MKQTGHRNSVLTWLADWRRFCLLLTLLFLVRGVFVLTILPPLEGWDEYQHIARLAFQDETGKSPAIGDRPDVPHSLFQTLRRFPNSETSRSHTSRFGGRTYGDFWTTTDTPANVNDDVSIFLYQSQQGPLYYRCMTPLYHFLDFVGHPLRTIAVLRLVNLLFGAMAIYVALRCVGGAMRPGVDRYLLAILISLQPLFLLNTARVANDAMAVFFGTLFIAILLRRGSRHWMATSLAAGVLLGLGVLAKATIAPLALLGIFATLIRPPEACRSPGRRSAALLLLVLGAAAVLSVPLYQNFQRYGAPFPMQETVNNQQSGKGVGATLTTAFDINWWRELGRRYLRHSLWVGGWSYLKPAKFFVWLQEAVIVIAAVGWLALLRRSTRRRACVMEDRRFLDGAIVVSISMALGIGYHMIQSQMSTGWIATNIWYAAVSFPFLLCLVYQGIDFFGARWLNVIATSLLAGVFVMAEVHGALCVMVPEYTAHAWGDVARERLRTLHWPLLGPTLTIPALIAIACLLALAVAGAIRGAAAQESSGDSAS
ncbi:MAG TPA: glycosyltransferase family 39 protein [Phycisphaerae bacterium]|nr:glycosyltransferase family 39 protein [Phycisphaerae bacterium]HRW53341.1 glycosyltransferase family 39 protein [Phycisphaerae bacterium]